MWTTKSASKLAVGTGDDMKLIKPPLEPGSRPPIPWLTDAIWNAADMVEREVLWCAWFCDYEQVRENPKNSNRGLWVDWFLRVAKVPAPNPWCASFQGAVAYLAGRKSRPVGEAAVINWVKSALLRHVDDPRRGDFAYWLADDGIHGHIMRVLKVNKAFIWTIEGNAQPGVLGDQRNGGGVYRRTRVRTKKIRFLRWR